MQKETSRRPNGLRLIPIRQTYRFSDKSWSNPNPDLPAGQAGVFMSGSRPTGVSTRRVVDWLGGQLF